MGKRGLYTRRKCRVCGVPFILGPLDPDVHVCPFHALKALKRNPHGGERTGKRKKWGKIGAPHSAKRKRFLAKLRRKR